MTQSRTQQPQIFLQRHMSLVTFDPPTNTTEAHNYALLITSTICSGTTILCASLFIVYVLIQTIRKKLFFRFTSLRILTYIQICELIGAITDFYILAFIYTPIPEPLCIIESMQSQFAETSGSLWTLCLSFFILITLVTNMRRKVIFEIVFHVIAWSAGIICATLPLIHNTYNRAGLWCWIDEKQEWGTIWMWSVSYIPAWLIVILVTILYVVIIIVVIRKRSSRYMHGHGTYMKLLAYPAVFILVWTFPTIYRIYQLAHGTNTTILFVFQLLLRVSLRCQGPLNALIFAFAPPEDGSLRELFERCGCVRRAEPEKVSSDDDERGLFTINELEDDDPVSYVPYYTMKNMESDDEHSFHSFRSAN
jgi:heme/copper-type cytochrome/quinol oxidase subunit 2